MIPVVKLQQLAKDWRERAKRCEERFMVVNPGQTQIAIDALHACADELDEFITACAAVHLHTNYANGSRKFNPHPDAGK